MLFSPRCLVGHVPFLVHSAVGKMLLAKLYPSIQIRTLSFMLVVEREEMKWQKFSWNFPN
ncbi:hypothetical protein Ccrd_026076 [Cynara cardunculus var. scolymus]|uniref:Uncharacterized protein n=1 Tax=Cynara cardunculus var. scolymus TaxID=59895 RepID=A0A103STF7_CYNCS|nr:hypothetical protein Ccrd_026076 [Cynara cardunculus var. scolymus]